MDFNVNLNDDKIWSPAEAETELARRGLGRPCMRWIEGDRLVYLLHVQVSPRQPRLAA
jgi:hypothetical protein